MGRPSKKVHTERMAKKVYRPWTAARVFEAKHKELREREWELRRLITDIEREVELIKHRLPLCSCGFPHGTEEPHD